MNESTSKRLAEDFLGLCQHANVRQDYGHVHKCLDCDELLLGNLQKIRNALPDFTTPDGWQLIADEIGKRGEWEKFYRWYDRRLGNNGPVGAEWSALKFHEHQPAEKSAIVAEWRDEVER